MEMNPRLLLVLVAMTDTHAPCNRNPESRFPENGLSQISVSDTGKKERKLLENPFMRIVHLIIWFLCET